MQEEEYFEIEAKKERLKKRVQHDQSQEDIIDLFLNPDAPRLVRVIAGPGTGKTSTICRLIKKMYLQSSKPLYENFLVLTFTKRTRIDLMRKIFNTAGNDSRKEKTYKRIRNFHSLAHGVVFWSKIIEDKKEREEFKNLLSDVNIDRTKAGEEDRVEKKAWRLVHQFMAQDLQGEKIKREMQKLQNKDPPVYRLIIRFQDWLDEQFQKERLTTFDYGIQKANQFMNLGKNCYNLSLDNLDLIIVDEFQDSNPAQLKMIKILMRRNKKASLLMIGDYDQNIYQWRGAEYQEVQKFIGEHEWKAMDLKYTYRLGEHVTNMTQQLINCHEPFRKFRQDAYPDYRLSSRNEVTNYPVLVQQFQDQDSEVRWVVETIYRLVQKGYQLRDMTILLRQFVFTSFYQKLKYEIQRMKKKTGKEEIFIDYLSNQNESALRKYFMAWLKYLFETEMMNQARGDQDDLKRILSLRQIVQKNDQVLKRILEHKRIDRMYLKYNQEQTGNIALKKKSWNAFFDDFDKLRQLFLSKEGSVIDLIETMFSMFNQSQWIKRQLLKNTLTESKFRDFQEEIQQVSSMMDSDEKREEPIKSVIRNLIDFEQVDSSLRDEMKKEDEQIQVKLEEGILSYIIPERNLKMQVGGVTQIKEGGDGESVSQGNDERPHLIKQQQKQYISVEDEIILNREIPSDLLKQQIDSSSEMKQQEDQSDSEKENKKQAARKRRNKLKSEPVEKRKELAIMKELKFSVTPKNRIQIQTIHKAKGLEYPIVFLCSLDHGFFMSKYEQNGQRMSTFAQRQNVGRQMQKEYQRQQSEELRLIYTAITRTSAYSFVSASRKNNLKWPSSYLMPAHKIFSQLKQMRHFCMVRENIAFDEIKDKETKDYIKIKQQQERQKQQKRKQNARKRAEKKERSKSQSQRAWSGYQRGRSYSNYPQNYQGNQ